MFNFLVISLLIQFFDTSHGFKIQPRIVNGFQSNPLDFPYFIYLKSEDESSHFFCGATLISDTWIVTAAHCIHGGDITAFIGIDANGDFYDNYTIASQRQFIHPEYSDETDANDIALLQLFRPIPSNLFVRPVKLPTQCDYFMDKENVITVGNGMKSYDGPHERDTKLRHAYLTTMSRIVCAHHTTGNNPWSIFCARPYHGSPSKGDSGGPLLLQSDETLIGITSFHVKTTTGGLFKQSNVDYNVFTRIHFYFDWIADTTGISLPKCAFPDIA